jgi:hypothetical protein
MCLKGMGQQSGDHEFWVPGLAGFRDAGLWSGYCAGLSRPGGPGPAELRLCMCVSPVWQALGVWLEEQRPASLRGHGPVKQSS